MVITLTDEQRVLVATLIQAKSTADRELAIVASMLLSGPWPGPYTGMQLDGNVLRFLGDE